MNRPDLSLGFKTEMFFHGYDGLIEDRGEYVVVKTPGNPGFMFGNFLLFFSAPKKGSLEAWKNLFRREFADQPEVEHFTFLWDSPTEGVGYIDDLQKENFKIDSSVVLTAKSVHRPSKYNSQVKVRPISTEAEWAAVTDNQVLSRAPEFEVQAYRLFKDRQMSRYRKMAEKGLGNWFGAFLNDKLVGDLGVYGNGNLGRFQSVETHPEFLRQGICSSLVYESAKFALVKMNLKELVMVADENYHAAKIYESVGFKPTAKEYSAFWWDKGQK